MKSDTDQRANDSDECEELRFKVRLLIRYGEAEPDEITRRLGMTPTVSNRAGDLRASTGAQSSGKYYRYNTWSWSVTVFQRRDFFAQVIAILDDLEKNTEFVLQLTESGAVVLLTVDLPGGENIGSVMSWRHLERFGRLKVDLGIEVFPDS